MKKHYKSINTILFLLLTIPLWSMESRELEEIIQNITNPATSIKNKSSYEQNKAEKNISQGTPTGKIKNEDKGKSISFPSPDEALLKSGIELFEASLYDNAKQKFEELRSKYPESPYRDITSIWLSKINIELNNFNEAINVLNSIGQESGEYPSALYSIGEINLKRGDESGAIEYFYRVASLFPDNELADDSLINIAKLYLKNGKGNQALEASIKVINNYDNRETQDDAYFIMALVFEKDPMLKDIGIARKIYKIFLKKADSERAPHFYNSPLLERVKNNLANLENTYYSKGF